MFKCSNVSIFAAHIENALFTNVSFQIFSFSQSSVLLRSGMCEAKARMNNFNSFFMKTDLQGKSLKMVFKFSSSGHALSHWQTLIKKGDSSLEATMFIKVGVSGFYNVYGQVRF